MSEIACAVDEEIVVLVDEHGRQIGTAAKASVHHEATPLHLGFSCYVFDGDGRVLLTRRALSKRTWPGAWSNSFCGHPSPGERPVDAVHRRARQELGLNINSVTCCLPDFRYRAVAADGTVENEICPVFCASADAAVRAAVSEVMEHRWVSWPELRTAARLAWALTPWAVVQVPLLDAAMNRPDGGRPAGHAEPARG
jgi:isopentenyl-diphosphate Delta-isomerase